MRTLGLFACVALSACRFSGPDGATVDGSPGGEMTLPGDAPDAPPDARLCFGTGLGMVCLASAPTMPLVLNGMIDTGISASCTEVIAVGGTMSCVLAGITVTVASGNTYRGIGSRPLVIVASEVMTIDGTLTVGSPRGGPSGAGASTAPCTAPGAPQNDDGGGGGGAGGSFMGPGGDGGVGDTNDNGLPAGDGDGGVHAAALPAIAALRAGCPGSAGGNGGGGGQGNSGNGGGALYLIAGTEIRISGRVSAFGGGGEGGDDQGGGGSGGSGGMIGLDAPAVNLATTGAVTANGGGGGEGGGVQAPRCDPGDDGATDGTRAAGGVAPSNDGGNDDGGNGGSGSGGGGGSAPNGATGDQNTGGGGGGGGGAGIIYVRGTLSATGATISPAASTN